MIRRLIHHYVHKIHELLEARDAPHSIAGGTGIGIFFGFIPIFGLKTLAAVGCAMATRCSILAAVVGVSLHDILLPVWPLILRYQFEVGFWMLSHPHHFPPPLAKSDFKISEIFQLQNFVDIGLPLALGGVMFAIPSSLLSYGVILLVLNMRAAHQGKRTLQAGDQEQP